MISPEITAEFRESWLCGRWGTAIAQNPPDLYDDAPIATLEYSTELIDSASILGWRGRL